MIRTIITIVCIDISAKESYMTFEETVIDKPISQLRVFIRVHNDEVTLDCFTCVVQIVSLYRRSSKRDGVE